MNNKEERFDSISIIVWCVLVVINLVFAVIFALKGDRELSFQYMIHTYFVCIAACIESSKLRIIRELRGDKKETKDAGKESE